MDKTQLIDALIESYVGDNKNGGPMWTAALEQCRISLNVSSGFMSKSRGSQNTSINFTPL